MIGVWRQASPIAVEREKPQTPPEQCSCHPMAGRRCNTDLTGNASYRPWASLVLSRTSLNPVGHQPLVVSSQPAVTESPTGDWPLPLYWPLPLSRQLRSRTGQRLDFPRTAFTAHRTPREIGRDGRDSMRSVASEQGYSRWGRGGPRMRPHQRRRGVC